MIKKVVSIIIITVFLFTFITGCGTKATQDVNDTTVEQTTKEEIQKEEVKKDPVQITVTHVWQGDIDFGKAITAIIDTFNKENPDIKVESNFIENATYQSKIKALIAADSLTEVHGTWGGPFSQQFIDANKIVFLNDDIKDIEDKVVSSAIFRDNNNNAYGISTSQWAICLFTNTSIMDKYGLKPAKTWEELINNVKTLKANGVTPIALGNKDGSELEWILNIMQYRYGGPDLIFDMHSGKASYNDKSWIEAAKKVMELVEAGAFPADAQSITYDEQIAMFKSGKAAMLFQGTWTEGTMLEAGEEFFKNVSVEAWPSMVGNDNDKVFLAACSDGLLVTTEATDEKKAAAIKFVKYLASEQASKYAVELSSQIPIRKGLDMSELKVSSLLAKTIEQINNNPWIYRNVQSNYATTTAYADILRSKLGNGLLMKIFTPEQFAEQMDKLMKEANKN